MGKQTKALLKDEGRGLAWRWRLQGWGKAKSWKREGCVVGEEDDGKQVLSIQNFSCD